MHLLITSVVNLLSGLQHGDGLVCHHTALKSVSERQVHQQKPQIHLFSCSHTPNSFEQAVHEGAFTNEFRCRRLGTGSGAVPENSSRRRSVTLLDSGHILKAAGLIASLLRVSLLFLIFNSLLWFAPVAAWTAQTFYGVSDSFLQVILFLNERKKINTAKVNKQKLPTHRLLNSD